MSNSLVLDELPVLTDEDVNILYSIVSLAAESKTPPFRALFAAYDTILAEHNIPTQHDQIYFRYLLRLGEGPTTSDNRDLIARFRALLARLDIHIVLGGDEDDDQYDGRDESRRNETHSLDEEAEKARDEHYAIGKPKGNRTKGKRRSSFNDSNLDATWVSGGRLETDRERATSHVRGSSVAAPEAFTKSNARPRRSSIDHSSPQPAQHQRSISGQSALKSNHASAASSQQYSRLTHDEEDLSLSSSYFDSPPASSPPPASRPHLSQQGPIPRVQPAYSVPDWELQDAAEAFYTTTGIRNIRHVLHLWHDHTIRQRQMREDLSSIAANHDRQILLNQAFSLWQINFDNRLNQAETERFFDHLDRRATRARNLFLLNKAFTHWSRCAGEEVARTNVARRHLLRIRYFNAWRDITAVNELKCRRVGLKKWFSVWREKTARRGVEHQRAFAIYEENLVEKQYWKWFWTLCERQAPIWRDARTKRSALSKITAHAFRMRQLNQTAQDMRRYYLLRNALAALGLQGQSVTLLETQAKRHRNTSLLSRSFNTLRKHSQLAPRWRQYEQETSTRLAVKTVSIWTHSTALAEQAAEFHRHRILRNAVTNWNDTLRIKVVTNMIDERVKAETYYKWVLADRLALFRRMMDYRLVERTFEIISLRLTKLHFRLGEAEAIFQENQRRRLLQSTMLTLNRKSRHEEMLERKALEFRNARLICHFIPTWKERTARVQELDKWSRDARYYCLTHSTLAHWKEATAEAKRTRRRNAYSTVRRRVKTGLVEKFFDHWRRRSSAVGKMEVQASERYQSRLFALGTIAFDGWRQMTAHLADMNAQSEEVYVRRLFEVCVAQLTARGTLILSNHQEADNYAEQTVHTAIKSEMMRRMKWQVFCLKRNKENASALKDRNSEQHRRNMVRYWADQAVQRKALKTIADPESPSKPTPNMFSSMRLPSARKPRPPPTPFARPATTGHLPDNALFSDNDFNDDDENEMDFGASTTTAKAEEWTSFDLLGEFGNNSNNMLPTLDEECEPLSGRRQQQTTDPTAVAPSTLNTPQPGYLRTPSKRTARQRTRFKALSNASTARQSKSQPPPSTFKIAPTHHQQQQQQQLNPSTANGPTRNNNLDFLASTTPAPFRSGGLRDMSALTPQVTPFERKMRAGGFGRSVFGGGPPPTSSTFASSTLSRRAGEGGGELLNGVSAQEHPVTGSTTPLAFGKSRLFARSVRGGFGAAGPMTTGRSVRFFDAVTSASDAPAGAREGGGDEGRGQLDQQGQRQGKGQGEDEISESDGAEEVHARSS
ncbi:hypothetical protein AAFC00_004363 [Neodothiora populina]|uniref:Sfi1 spindle body domain-containing protein n=1 Tax=Neodothiora populina TaxID=2781224 RepID=A0ABR3PJP8_9PEZI